MNTKRKIIVGGVAVVATAMLTLGGSATAASQITSADIASQTIQSWDIDRGGVASSEVRNQSLQSWDLDRGSVGASELRNGTIGSHELTDELRAQVEEGGPKGDKGDPGTDGTDGADGADGVSRYEVVGRGSDSLELAAGETAEITTLCASEDSSAEQQSEVALGGGAKAAAGAITLDGSYPSAIEEVTDADSDDPAGRWKAGGWAVQVTAGPDGATVQPYVTCAAMN